MRYFQAIAMILFSAVLVEVYWHYVPVKAVREVAFGDEIFGRGDGGRFVCQGWWLKCGRGFRTGDANGYFCTSLPPGYPAFLGFMFLLTEDLNSVRYVQGFLHVVSGLVFFLGLRRVSPKMAFLGGIVICGSPWAAAMATTFMSEVWSTFLSVLLMVNVVCLRENACLGERSRFSGFLTGMMASMTCLSAPALTPICAGLVLCCGILLRKRRGCLALLLLGAVIPMSVWQTHCIVADGRPCLTLLTPLKENSKRIFDWILAWARTEQEATHSYGVFVWSLEPVVFDGVPTHAFRDRGEYEEFFILANAAAEERAKDQWGARLELLAARCGQVATERRLANPILVRLVLPFSRALAALLNFRDVDFRSFENAAFLNRLNPLSCLKEVEEFGLRRAAFRFGRGLLALWSIAIHWTTVAVVFCALWLSCRADWFGKSLMVLLIVFLFMFGKHAPEARRLIPSIPIFLAVFPLSEIARLRKLPVEPEVKGVG